MHTCAPHNLCIYWAIQVEFGVEVRLKDGGEGVRGGLGSREGPKEQAFQIGSE